MPKELGSWGRCHEQQGTPPFWPWVQAIRAYVREHNSEQLRSDMGAGPSVIAEELVISLNIVARHVSNIFSKTGSSNRTEAAAYANRNKLA